MTQKLYSHSSSLLCGYLVVGSKFLLVEQALTILGAVINLDSPTAYVTTKFISLLTFVVKFNYSKYSYYTLKWILSFYFIGSKNPRWTREVRAIPISWRNHIQKWVGSMKVPTLVIQYEKLLTNLYVELKRIMEFLEFSYTEEDIQCTIRSSTEQFHRSHNGHFDPYTKEQKLWILKQIHLANKILRPYNITYGSKR